MTIRRVGPFYSLGGAASGYPGSTQSISLDGLTEGLLTAQNNTKIGPNDSWTLSLWHNPDIVSINDYLICIHGDTSTNENRIIVYSRSATTLTVELYNSAGTKFKDFDYDAPCCLDEIWNMLTVTWDGTNLILYNNDEVITPTKNTDNAGSQNDDLYEIAIGMTTALAAPAKFNGVYSFAIWDSVLSAAEVTAIFNSGDGSNFDLTSNSGDYTSSSDLSHYWIFGRDSDNIGKDYITESADFDLLRDDIGPIGAGNIVAIYPDTDDLLKRSIDFDGTGERLRSLNRTDVGYNNAFTIAMWFWSDIVAAGDYFLDINDGSNNNRTVWYTTTNNTTWVCDVYNSAGTKFKSYKKDTIDDNTWALYAVSWDGSTLTMSKNGVDVSPTKTTDNAGTQTSDVDTISLGNIYNGNFGGKGNIFQCMIWDEAIGLAELVALYNGGDGINSDPTSDSGDYTSSANLIRFFRPGYDSDNLGLDLVSGTIDLMDDDVNISKADISSKAPFV
jgi:hypothetical protein